MIKKKLAGILLSVILVCSSAPVTAFAQGEVIAGSEMLTNISGEEPEVQTVEQSADNGQSTEDSAASVEEMLTPTPTPVITEILSETEAQPEDTSGQESAENSESTDTAEDQSENEAEAESEDQETEEDTETEKEAETEEATEEASVEEKETKDESENSENQIAVASEGSAAVIGEYASDSNPGNSSVSETAKFVPGTYTITANLYVPSEYNSVLKVNAYMTNPDNPAGNTESGGRNLAPTAPMRNNATITIGEDGKTKTLTVQIVNPVFTLQSIGGCTKGNAEITGSKRNNIQYSGTTTSKNGRITQLVVDLKDNTGVYQFDSCSEFPTILNQDWSVPLILAVDLASLETDSSVKFSEGENQTWKSGSGNSLDVIVQKSHSNFTGVQVDGKVIEATNYDAFQYTSTSTYVALKANYLETLPNGSHNLTVLFKEGDSEFYANTKFTVKKKESTSDSNKTGKLAEGTYTITANLSMPGEYNPVIPGTTVYANNPNNPFGPTLDENKKSEVENEIPNTPLSMNAELVVNEKGEKYLYLPVKNPVFTLQKLGTCSKLKDVQTETVKPTKGSKTGQYEGDYGDYTTRIHLIRVKLTDDLKSGTKTYNFKGSVLYAVPIDTELAPTGKIALQLTIDYSSAKKKSKSTKVTDLKGNSTDSGEKDSNKKDSNNSGKDSNKNTNKDTNTDATGGSSTLKPGTYTVAANIWIDKSSSGLPLNPHLTSSIFPPKDPVSNNAKVTIDENYNAVVTVPIVIQSKVMSIKSIGGLNITNSSSSGGYLTSITVDLGKVTNPKAVITQSCTVSLDLGYLAQQIAKKEQAQVWGATFQVNFSGVASGASGGGNVDVNALINGASGTTGSTSTTGTNIRIGVTESAELAALLSMMEEHKNDTEIKETTETAASTDSTEATTDTASTQSAETKVENAYLFTIEELDEKTIAKAEKEKEESDAKDKELTEEEKAELLSEQFLKHFTDGTYDLVYITAEQAETLAQDKDFKDQFYFLTQIEYTEKTEEEDSEDADTKDTSAEESSDTDSESTETANETSDTNADGEASETKDMYLAVSKSFVDKHASVLTEVISNVKDSAKTASEKPQETAVSVVSLGAGDDSAETLELLNDHDIEITSGAELKTAVKELSEQEEYKDLSEDLCYVAETTAANAAGSANAESTDANSADSENAAADSTAGTDASSDAEETANTESTDETASTEKIKITDADSLSAALDQALANKSDDADADGDSEDTELSYSNSSNLDMEAEKVAAEALEPGTYTLSVNLYLPGERNTQLPGTTAYMTNPDNPLGVGGHEGIPMTPVADNATLVVGEDGTKTVTVDIVNPVFTLQKIAEPQNSTILAGVKDSDRYEGTNGVGVDGRITQLVIELGDDGGIYPFDDCAEFPTLLETDWYVPLEMSVEFTTAEKTSDETTVEVPEDTAGAATEDAADTEE